mgnify:CR=1 FL=1|tara:strand:- start:421 stop:675 length:255 start_codon:yes stop_codon:yes gene_type:complete
MTQIELAQNIEQCSPTQIMHINSRLLNDLSSDRLFAILSDDGSNYQGDLDNLADEVNALSGIEELEFCQWFDTKKKKYGKDPLC